MIYNVRKDYQGYWIIWGEIGYRRYLYYTKKEAIELYKKECKGERL